MNSVRWIRRRKVGLCKWWKGKRRRISHANHRLDWALIERHGSQSGRAALEASVCVCVCVCGLTVRRRGQIGLPPLPLYRCGRRLNRTTSFLSYSEPASFLLSDYLSLGSPLFFFYFHFLFPSIFISISIPPSFLFAKYTWTATAYREDMYITAHNRQANAYMQPWNFLLSLFYLFCFGSL